MLRIGIAFDAMLASPGANRWAVAALTFRRGVKWPDFQTGPLPAFALDPCASGLRLSPSILGQRPTAFASVEPIKRTSIRPRSSRRARPASAKLSSGPCLQPRSSRPSASAEPTPIFTVLANAHNCRDTKQLVSMLKLLSKVFAP
jgi:hypothetical protein